MYRYIMGLVSQDAIKQTETIQNISTKGIWYKEIYTRLECWKSKKGILRYHKDSNCGKQLPHLRMRNKMRLNVIRTSEEGSDLREGSTSWLFLVPFQRGPQGWCQEGWKKLETGTGTNCTPGVKGHCCLTMSLLWEMWHSESQSKHHKAGYGKVGLEPRDRSLMTVMWGKGNADTYSHVICSSALFELA